MNSPAAELPGEDIVKRGLADLAAGCESIPALLVQVARPRLQRLGVHVPPVAEHSALSAEIRLYRGLRRDHQRDAYSRYNALLRLITSYARALEHQQQSQRRQIIR